MKNQEIVIHIGKLACLYYSLSANGYIRQDVEVVVFGGGRKEMMMMLLMGRMLSWDNRS